MTLQNEFNELFPDYKKTKEGHASLTDRTCEVIKEIYEIAQPKKILEIGFNAGHTAFGWLSMFPELHYHSIDICKHHYTVTHAKKIKDKFGERFKFGNTDSKKLTADHIQSNGYDFVFIDGDHTFDGISHDYQICKDAGTKWILIDDYSLRKYIRNLLQHINLSDNHPYEIVKIFTYDDHDATSRMALFRRID